MQVSSISNQFFSGKRDNIDKFITMDDSDIRRYAVMKASQDNEKRVKKTNRLYYSIPLIAAASAAALTKGKATFLTNELSGKASKLANAVKNGGYWAFLLGTAAAGAAVSNKIENKSEKYHNFRQNHPIMALTGDIAAFLAATAIIPRALYKAYGKLGPKTTEAINKGVNKVANGINNIKTPKFIKKIGEKVSKIVPNRIKTWKANAVMPETIKAIGKTVVCYAPHITLLSAFFASLNNRARFMNDVDATYSQIRNKQQRLVNARLAELKAQ